jgi:cyanophycinase
LSRLFCCIFLGGWIQGILALAAYPADTAAGIEAAGIRGSLVICGGGKLPEEVAQQFMKLAGGTSARLVIIPTASTGADEAGADHYLSPWRKRKPASVVLLHTRSRARADAEDFTVSLREATGVWFGGGSQARVAEAYLGTGVEKELYALLARGGVVGGTSAGAAIMSRVMISGGTAKADLGTGFNLLPGSVIDQHFTARNRRVRLVGVISARPALVGYGIDEGTALIARGRSLQVLGEGTVSVLLGPAGKGDDESRPLKEQLLRKGQVADLTALRRAALLRAGERFPPASQESAVISKGALVLGGGGGMPAGIVRRFIELAGGPQSLIAIIPGAMEDPVPQPPGEERMLRRQGARNLVVLHSRRPGEKERKHFAAVLNKAGGVWFCGGRQWRLVDAYGGTGIEKLFHDVLGRGGVVGGSSAGASIQASYMARGNPLGNRDIMAEGYEKGFGFLPGTAVDQHFSQRGRLADMEALVARFPQLLGIGLDESTAIVVRGSVAEVMGLHKAHFYAGDKRTRLGAKSFYNLKRRAALPVR